ncbi:hypothetical protein SAMN05443665_10719 [Actinomadura meyerae]|uniref:Uncharacterized protein n=2 Tax=Actinomadura TaxID=1988 RepID=A0A239P5V5_9ACTN|nr:hypothetical protein SAMN05443665_10719 [Actinomadura meyerae]
MFRAISEIPSGCRRRTGGHCGTFAPVGRGRLLAGKLGAVAVMIAAATLVVLAGGIGARLVLFG